MRISDWSSDVCSSDLAHLHAAGRRGLHRPHRDRRLSGRDGDHDRPGGRPQRREARRRDPRRRHPHAHRRPRREPDLHGRAGVPAARRLPGRCLGRGPADRAPGGHPAVLPARALRTSARRAAPAHRRPPRPPPPTPPVATPTPTGARGVNPICTAEPACPLHDVSLADALVEGRPIALLVATPAFCQIAICGPVLDVLLEATGGHPDVRFLHAEVYANPGEGLEEYAPIVSELGLHFEPCLLLIGADGTLVERLDTIYDRSELDERLTALV